jgi:hypothetical protein
MSFNDGSGAILLQSFTLADGQICVKAMLEWSGAVQPGVQAIYPKEDGFNWPGAACRIAEAWLDGPPAGSVLASPSAGASEESAAAPARAEDARALIAAS